MSAAYWSRLRAACGQNTIVDVISDIFLIVFKPRTDVDMRIEMLNKFGKVLKFLFSSEFDL